MKTQSVQLGLSKNCRWRFATIVSDYFGRTFCERVDINNGGRCSIPLQSCYEINRYFTDLVIIQTTNFK